jgi:O-antigen ligase
MIAAPARSVTPALATRLDALALVLACVAAASLAFHHTIALRLYALGAAAVLVFFTGGWRELAGLPLRNAWLLWAAAAGVSVAFAQDRRHAVGEFTQEIVYGFAAFATWYTLARRADGARWLARTLAAAAAAVLLLGALRYGHEGPWFNLGEYGDVGTLSTFLVTVLPVMLFLALRTRTRSAERALAVALVVGALIGGFLTLNRMFWFAAAAEIAIFALFSLRHLQTRRRGAWIGGVLVVVVALALLQVLLASESRIALFAPGMRVWDFVADDPRGELWPFAVQQIGAHPWLGAGIGKWSSRAAFDARFHDPMLLHAHNVFLNRALETGLPGLAAFVVLLAAAALAFVRLARSDDAGTSAIGAAGLALVAGVVLKNLTDDFFVRQSAMLFWSLTGAALGAASRRTATV